MDQMGRVRNGSARLKLNTAFPAVLKVIEQAGHALRIANFARANEPFYLAGFNGDGIYPFSIFGN